MFFIRLFGFACLATSCAPTFRALCETRCGLALTGYNSSRPDAGIYSGDLPDGWTCKDFQEAEDAAYARFKLTSESRLNGKQGDLCTNIRGWSVTVHPATAWVSSLGDGIYGQTFCAQNLLEIGNTKNLKETSLYHELVHVAQKCNPSQPPDRGEDEDHADWTRNGVRAALKDLYEQNLP